ncbi:hypothetical protein SLEP1_g53224 [Rubroshorea leprosula]|uniref:F-box associated domain-containing protein n=1 Tax=Rubroshorea leprosula TaxID=152421 RepID=A0AAV5M8S2_9ROSI|nr:hypothetical protein SLEP1_g53224 [Rubroshorea leprosula]
MRIQAVVFSTFQSTIHHKTSQNSDFGTHSQGIIIQGLKDTNFAIGTHTTTLMGFAFDSRRPTTCNGLVSAHLYSKETNRSSIVVWNPLTMEQRRCPMPQRCRKDIQLFGFGYDSVSNVAATTPAFARKLAFATEAKHLNGCIYWLISREGRSNCGIVSFDLSTDRLREEESVIYDVWMMEENVMKLTKSWIKLFRVNSTDGNFNTPLNDPMNRDVMTAVCFTGNRKVLIYWHSRYEYALYDPDYQSVKKVAENGNPLVDSWPVRELGLPG